jgi:hypothetical protein
MSLHPYIQIEMICSFQEEKQRELLKLQQSGWAGTAAVAAKTPALRRWQRPDRRREFFKAPGKACASVN